MIDSALCWVGWGFVGGCVCTGWLFWMFSLWGCLGFRVGVFVHGVFCWFVMAGGVVPCFLRAFCVRVFIWAMLNGFTVFCGEFDPGSGRTLAACLTHASRTMKRYLYRGLVANG